MRFVSLLIGFNWYRPSAHAPSSAIGSGRGTQPGEHRQVARGEPGTDADEGIRGPQDILKGTKVTFVFGSGEMLDQVRKLTGQAEKQDAD